MKNPNGPYPGRQIFLGLTASGKPAFAYLVTGRSPASRERKATVAGNSVIMGPIGNEAYDSLRHYTAVKYDNGTGLMTVSNGIQTEAVFEAYRLIYHTKSQPGKECLETIMTSAKYEPDSLHTPRITGLITNPADKTEPVFILSIITDSPPAKAFEVLPKPGTLAGISTYNGDLANPTPLNLNVGLPVIQTAAETPEEIAGFIYGISEAFNQGDDIRVCAVAGVRSEDNLTWKLAVVNRHK